MNIIKNTKPQDLSKYEAICFDEVKMYGPHYLSKIYNFMGNTDKKVFATGDSDQLQPFGFYLNNVTNVKEYMKRCIDIMFPNQIILEHNKRLKTIQDQLLLIQIKEDIFNPNIDAAVTMRKYFKTIHKYQEIKTKINYSFFNFRSEKVNKIMQSKMVIPENSIMKEGFCYYKGLEIICKKHYKTKNVRLYTNYNYLIDEIDNKKFTILEPVEGIKMTLDIKY